MAPRKRRAAAQAPPADEDSGNEAATTAAAAAEEASDAESVPLEAATDARAAGLRFNESLLGRPGRPIPVGTLLKRLQKLSEELRALDQDVSDEFKEACQPVAKELGDQSILAHKDKGVRAWAAQCIVDVLALCAPDAPFSLQQLKAVFEMFIKTIFPALADPNNAYSPQHIYVLESLANIKSILLITDLPNANKLITQLFTTFFDIYSGTARGSTGEEPVAKHVEYTMLNALVTLVDEADALPQDVIDIIVAQFLRADPRLVGQKEQKPKKGEKIDDKQTTLVRQELPTGYLMAKDICNMVSEKMAREVSKYFSEVIMEASGVGVDGKRRKGSGEAEDAEDAEQGISEEDLKELQKAHRLVRELWRACPSVLQSVIPQLEAELSAENVQLRVLATETLGDLISGIGAAGPPPNPPVDAGAYPPVSLSTSSEPPTFDPMTTPKAPQPFSQVHPQAYSSFLGRRQDKAPAVRAAWTIEIGRILTTNAGGVGIGSADEKKLVEDLARMLNDAEEKVRLAAVNAIESFSCYDAINKLGSVGGVDKEGSVLANLAVHIKDRKPAVRSGCMTALARLWGVSHAEIAEGNQQVIDAVGSVPSHVLNSYYTNSSELFELLDKAIFEELLPLNYPPLKSKGKEKSSSGSQRPKDSQTNEKEGQDQDADAIRAERILLLVHGLDEKAKKIFYSICARQASVARYFQIYLQVCESYNGGVMDKDEDETKKKLTQIIKAMSEMYPETQKVSSDLWKFAKMHDRRSYQLLRFCMDPKSDYKTVKGAVRELNKRLAESSHPTLTETLIPIIYRVGLMIYNRSHVPAILSFSTTNEKGLASTAHELLKDMSSRNPEVLETHIRDMCQSLQDNVPSATKANNPGAVDNLKACAAFARKFPQKLPQDRKFIQAMSSYAVSGSPPEAGKHAVSIIMATSSRKETMAKELAQKCLKGFKYGEAGFLTRLAALSQLMLLAPKETDNSAEAIFDIAQKEILIKRRNPAKDPKYVWAAEVDDECTAKMWAIKIVVNRVRSHPDEKTLATIATPVISTLSTLVANEGELSAAKDTPEDHKPHLRLLAAISLLKICRIQNHDALLDPVAFEKLAEVAQDRLFAVRGAFLGRLRKYLNRNSLPPRFYTIPFLLAYEPDKPFRHEMTTWLKHRREYFAKQKVNAPVNGKASAGKPRAPTTMESTLPRLLSLIAHHPDYDAEPRGLQEMSRYITFYLICVATPENVSLIYHLAQRVKAHQDVVLSTARTTFSQTVKKAEEGIDFNTRIYTLSDLTCAVMRAYVDAFSWSIQTLPARAKLPFSLFGPLRSHEDAVDIAEKDFIPESFREMVDNIVRDALRKKAKTDGRKRKSEVTGATGDEDGEKKTKRVKRTSSGKAKSRLSKRRGDDWSDDGDASGRRPRDAEAEKNRRKSGRSSNAIKYNERNDDEDDEEMLDGVAEWEYENGERWREQGSSSSEDDEGSEDDEDEGNEKLESSKANGHDDEDVEMTEDGEKEDDKEDTPETSPPSATKSGKTGPKGRALKAASTSKPAPKSNARPVKASAAAAAKEAQRALPTRSGRATRSAAA